MGEFTQVSSFDPASGARTSAPAFSHSGLDVPAWNPPGDLVSAAPADQPYETGEAPRTGPTPSNIIGGELRAFDDDFGDSDNGDISDDFDDDFSDLDGDDVAQDGDCCDDGDCDDCDDTGPVADNIVVVDSRGLRGAMGLTPGPLSRSRM